jgi:WD40 repeat protein
MPNFNYQQFQCLFKLKLPIKNAEGQGENFYQFCMTPDWQYLITSSYPVVRGNRSLPEMMRFWNWRTGELERTVELHNQFLWPERITPDGLYALSKGSEKRVDVWSLETGKTVHQISGHRGNIGRMAVSQDGKTIATSGWDELKYFTDLPVDIPAELVAEDRTIMLWDWQNDKLLHTIETNGNHILFLCFLDEQLLASMHEYDWKIWNWQTGTLVRSMLRVPTTSAGLSYSYSAIVASFFREPADAGKVFRAWDFNTTEVIQTFRSNQRLEWMRFSPDDRLLVSRAYHARPQRYQNHLLSQEEYDAAMKQWRETMPSMQVWSIETGKIVGEINQLPRGIEKVDFNPDGCNMVIQTEQTIEVWGVHPSL